MLTIKLYLNTKERKITGAGIKSIPNMEVQLNLEEIGKRLRRLREEKGITQSKLSEEFRCKRESISHYEKGKQLPNIDRLWDYMCFFHVSADYILSGKEPQNLEPLIREIQSVCSKYECNN